MDLGLLDHNQRVSDLKEACERFQHDRFVEIKELLSQGDVITCRHSESCVGPEDACLYVGVIDNGGRRVRINGKEYRPIVPYCRSTYPGGKYRNIVDALAEELGTSIISAWENVWCESVTEDMQRQAWKSVETFMLGGPWEQTRYVLKKTYLRELCRMFPRERCECGEKRLSRGAENTPTHTYLVEDKPFLKIGKSVNVAARWSNVTDNPRPVAVLAVLCGDKEKLLHAEFGEYRHKGEWFRAHPSIYKAFGVSK